MTKRNTICPFLGLKEDGSTSLSFPSPGNHCYHSRPVSPVNAEHQNQFCLTSGHVNCPVFQAAHPISLPETLAIPREAPRTWRKTLTVGGIPVLVALAAVMLTPWNGLSAWLSVRRNLPNTEGGKTQNWALLHVTGTPSAQVENIPEDHLVPVNCPMPPGWTTYIVQPTDSLYRLSVIYGVSVGEIQQFNCMGNETAILPGQAIFLPIFSTSTPVPTPTPTPAPIQQVAVNQSSDDDDDERRDPTASPTDVSSDPDSTRENRGDSRPPKDKDGKDDDKEKGKGKDKDKDKDKDDDNDDDDKGKRKGKGKGKGGD